MGQNRQWTIIRVSERGSRVDGRIMKWKRKVEQITPDPTQTVPVPNPKIEGYCLRSHLKSYSTLKRLYSLCYLDQFVILATVDLASLIFQAS